MFLNDIGQPLILDRQKTYGPYEQHNGPLLLTSAAFREYVRPNNWCGQVIGSADHVKEFQRTTASSNETHKYYTLKPYLPTDYEYKGIKHILTLIPAGHTESMYYIQNNCVKTVIVDKLTGFLDFIPKAGPNFQRALQSGIDVMYIDDACYISDEDWTDTQRENIYTLVDLIRPKYLYGLRQDKLPSCVLNLCAHT